MVVSLDGHGQTKAFIVSRRRARVSDRKTSTPVKKELKVSMLGVQGGKPEHVSIDRGKQSTQNVVSYKERVALFDSGSKLGRPSARGIPSSLPLVGVLSVLREEAARTNQLFAGRFFGGFMRGDMSEGSPDALAFFAGAAPFGAHLEVILTDIAGSEIGRSSTYADAAGHWNLPLHTLELTHQAYLLELRLSAPTWEAASPIRAYFVTLAPEFVALALEYTKRSEDACGILLHSVEEIDLS
ncbi:MAG: hypothetical protein L3J39_07660 [Verrucomicrobiales bacterium]|nr:hypothetical protein [Verrucomicrobiales bacterium]